MQKYIQQTGNAHPNYEYIRVRTQHVQVVLSTSITLAHYCGRQVYLLALALTSASLGQLGASTFNDCTARGTSRWKCHPFHSPLCISIGGSRGHVPPPPLHHWLTFTRRNFIIQFISVLVMIMILKAMPHVTISSTISFNVPKIASARAHR